MTDLEREALTIIHRVLVQSRFLTLTGAGGPKEVAQVLDHAASLTGVMLREEKWLSEFRRCLTNLGVTHSNFGPLIDEFEAALRHGPAEWLA